MNVRPSIEDVVTVRPAKRHVPFDERNRPRSGEPAETAPPREDSAKRNRKAASAGTNIVTEDGAACRFADLHGDKLRFCHDTGSWFEWDGSIWRQNRMGIAHSADGSTIPYAASPPGGHRNTTHSSSGPNGASNRQLQPRGVAQAARADRALSRRLARANVARERLSN
jgi:hypothetical protein